MNYAIFNHLKAGSVSGVVLKDQVRKRNAISYFTSKGECSIPELAELLNISIPKTTELITQLQEEGLVMDTSRKTDGLGRKAAIYSLNPDSCYFLGVEIKKYKINIGLMSFNTKLKDTTLHIPFDFLESGESLKEIIKEIQNFLAKTRIPKNRIIGLGLSLAGRINVKTSQILSIYHFGDSPIKEILEREIGLPVFIDNDSRTVAYGEYHFGNGGMPYQEKNVCVVNLDYGLAIGIFSEGRPVYGASGYAGEIGHIPMFNNEKICFCGKKGCLETEASGLALINLITQKIREGSNSRLQKALDKKGFIELEDVVEAVQFGDNLAIEGVSQIAFNLGKGLAVAINLLNPDLIVLGGMLAPLGEQLLLPVKTAIMQYSLSLVNNDTKIAISSLGPEAGLLGCCLLVRDKALELV